EDRSVPSAAGFLDPAFSYYGLATSTIPGQLQDVVVQPDGQIVAAGSSGGATLVLRYDRRGEVYDTTFNGGIFTGEWLDPGKMAVALAPDGKVVVAGSRGGDFGVFRLNPNGTPDASFSGG